MACKCAYLISHKVYIFHMVIAEPSHLVSYQINIISLHYLKILSFRQIVEIIVKYRGHYKTKQNLFTVLLVVIVQSKQSNSLAKYTTINPERNIQ